MTTRGRIAAQAEVAVIGGGPAGLMAAAVLAEGGAHVTLYERMPSAGRKLLLAGRGGLNLTHSEALERLLARYGATAERLRAAMLGFPPEALRAFSESLGQPTFVGSSGRVFPQSFKTSPLLRAWLRRIDAAGVAFKPRHLWCGWDDGALAFEAPPGRVTTRADATVLALGGASWPRLGSDGGWTGLLIEAGIRVTPLAPANCGFIADWTDVFRSRFEGAPLKRIALTFASHTVRGEAIVTRSGLEGGGIYAISAPLREAIAARGEAILRIDLRPDWSPTALAAKLSALRGKQSLATFLRKRIALPPVGTGLLHEATKLTAEGPAGMTPEALAGLIKAVPVRLTGTAPLKDAISTAGGVAWEEIDDHYMLRHMPGVFVAGEMIDWEAPTGGYLLQAVLATAVAASRGALTWLRAAERTAAARSAATAPPRPGW